MSILVSFKKLKKKEKKKEKNISSSDFMFWKMLILLLAIRSCYTLVNFETRDAFLDYCVGVTEKSL